MVETVKIKSNGYLLNGELYVPKEDGNRHYEEIKVWIAEGNTPEPEFTEAEIKEQRFIEAKDEASRYLNETDWMVTRQAEGVKPIPEEVKIKRQEARELLSSH